MAKGNLSLVAPVGAGVARMLKQPLYDTEVFLQASPANTLTFFQKPQGQTITYGGSSVSKSIWHTNMNLAGQLAPPNKFTLAGFRVEIEAGVLATTHLALYKWGVFRWYFGNNRQLEIPLSQIPQGVAMDGFGGTTAYVAQGDGTPIFYDFRLGKQNQEINPSESFKAKILFPTDSEAPYADTYVRVYAVGVLHSQL